MFDRQPSWLPREANVTMELTASYLISPQLTTLNPNCTIMLFLLTASYSGTEVSSCSRIFGTWAISWVSPHLISSCAHSRWHTRPPNKLNGDVIQTPTNGFSLFHWLTGSLQWTVRRSLLLLEVNMNVNNAEFFFFCKCFMKKKMQSSGLSCLKAQTQ